MEEEILDFSKITLDDVKVPGSEQEPTQEPTQEPVQDPTPEPTPVPEVTPVPEQTNEPVKEPARDESPYKFIEEDEFLKGLIDYYKKTNDLTPYLQAKSIDFSQMSDAEIMRRNLREQYPDVSDKAFDRLYQKEIVEKFKLDEDAYDLEDVELGRELLKSEASKAREKYIEWQKSFTAPEPKAAPQEKDPSEDLKVFEQTVRSNEVTKSILEEIGRAHV